METVATYQSFTNTRAQWLGVGLVSCRIYSAGGKDSILGHVLVTSVL